MSELSNREIGLAFDLAAALHMSKTNGHVPGYLFSDHICFCKKCNSPLTFKEINRKNSELLIGGFSQSTCNG